jgi:hypothetical protein
VAPARISTSPRGFTSNLKASGMLFQNLQKSLQNLLFEFPLLFLIESTSTRCTWANPSQTETILQLANAMSYPLVTQGLRRIGCRENGGAHGRIELIRGILRVISPPSTMPVCTPHTPTLIADTSITVPKSKALFTSHPSISSNH